MSKWGLLSGFGQGLSQSAGVMMADKLDQMKEERLQRYRQQEQEQLFSHQKTMQADGFANAKSIQEMELANKPVRTEYVEGDGRTFQVGYNAEGVKISEAEVRADPVRRVFSAGDDLYDAFTGERFSGSGSGGGSPFSKAQIDAANATIRDLNAKAENGELSEEEAKYYQDALRIRASAMYGGEIPGGSSTATLTPEDFARATQQAEDYVKSMAGMFRRDAEDFAQFGGSRNTAKMYYTEYFLPRSSGERFPAPAEWMRLQSAGTDSTTDSGSPDSSFNPDTVANIMSIVNEGRDASPTTNRGLLTPPAAEQPSPNEMGGQDIHSRASQVPQTAAPTGTAPYYASPTPEQQQEMQIWNLKKELARYQRDYSMMSGGMQRTRLAEKIINTYEKLNELSP